MKLGSCVIVKRGNFKRDGMKFLIKRDCEFKILTLFDEDDDDDALNYGQLLCETWIVNRVTKRGSLWSHQTWFLNIVTKRL